MHCTYQIISATFQSSIWTECRYWSTIDLEIYALYRRFLKLVGSCQNLCTDWDIAAVRRPSLYSYIGAQTSKRMELTAPLTLLEKGFQYFDYCIVGSSRAQTGLTTILTRALDDFKFVCEIKPSLVPASVAIKPYCSSKFRVACSLAYML